MIDRIVVGLNDAADRESDVARRSKIRDVAAQLGGALRDVAVDVTAAVVAKQAGA